MKLDIAVIVKSTARRVVRPATFAISIVGLTWLDQRFPGRWWSKFFSWPEGITVCGILATLYAVAWQSIETARSAKATELASAAAHRQINLTVAKERARLVVNKGALEANIVTPTLWFLDGSVTMRNMGTSRAFIVAAKGQLYVENSKGDQYSVPADELTFQNGVIDPGGEDVIVPLTYYPGEAAALSGYANKIYEGSFVPVLRGYVVYETLGLSFRRRFSYRWRSHKEDFFGVHAILVDLPGDDYAGKIRSGSWTEENSYGNGEEEVLL